jgi:uncharacterized protein (TIRG00374 family)
MTRQRQSLPQRAYPRSRKKLIVGLIFSAVFLFLALRNIDWSTFFSSLKAVQLIYIIPSILFTFLGHYARAYRWKYMLEPVKDVRTNRLFSVTVIGFMANNLLPARLGEIIRAYVLGETEGISKTASFATIVFERVVDVFSLLVLLWFTILNHPGLGWLKTGGYWILLANLILLIALFIMNKRKEGTERFLRALSQKLPEAFGRRVLSVGMSFMDGLRVIGQARSALLITLISVPVWAAAMLGIYFCLVAMGMHLPFLATICLIVLISLGSMIPSAPAYIGTTQYACILGLGLFGVGKSEALAFSILYHATQFFPVTLLGFVFLWKSRLGLRDMAISSDGS